MTPQKDVLTVAELRMMRDWILEQERLNPPPTCGFIILNEDGIAWYHREQQRLVRRMWQHRRMLRRLVVQRGRQKRSARRSALPSDLATTGRR